MSKHLYIYYAILPLYIGIHHMQIGKSGNFIPPTLYAFTQNKCGHIQHLSVHFKMNGGE